VRKDRHFTGLRCRLRAGRLCSLSSAACKGLWATVGVNRSGINGCREGLTLCVKASRLSVSLRGEAVLFPQEQERL